MKAAAGFVTIIIGLFIFASLVGAVRAREEHGKIVAKIDFDPERDGFAFGNYGRDRNGENDLSAGDLILMFGADKVCIEGRTAEDCVLYQTAEQWMRDRIESMAGGRCDGFSVTSMRAWQKLPFKGKSRPDHWQADATVIHDLGFDDRLANYIAFYHSLQLLPEINKFRSQTFKFAPSRFVALLTESFRTGKEYYTLGVGMLDENGKYTRGHSILPFAVEEMGDGEYRIHVYDNNFPGQTKYLTVNTTTETWRYNTASNPNETAEEYVGDKTTQTMSLKKMSDRDRSRFQCPFCEKTKTAGRSQTKAEIYFSFTGEGDLLITDPAGKQIGYDDERHSPVNQISAADVGYNDGGLGLNYSPDYVLPYDATAERPYRILISGGDLEGETNADLQITAPGFVVGFEDIRLDPNERLLLSVSPDGRTLSFSASEDGETPAIYLTTEDGSDRPSYSFLIGGVSIEGGKTLTAALDLENGKVYFKDDDDDEDPYDVGMIRTNPDGSRNEFAADDLNIGRADSFQMDFGTWDGKGKMSFRVDENGDGFEDEEEIRLNNEYKPKPQNRQE
jgi:hypothetical protein